MAYSSDDLQRIATDFEKWQSASRQLAYAFLRRDFRCGETSSIVAHGLVRRLETLRHCMQRTFEHVAPENVEPTRLAMLDATAYLQSFIFNLYGALDNLARIWCREAAVVDNKGRPIADQQMGFTSKNDLVRRSLSAQFRNYLQKHDPWFEYLSNYRHALAHRIPLYIPPSCLAPDEAET